jgi:hypothetical protein
MNYILSNELRVLAINPSSRGLGFVVLEGPLRLIDWGVKQVNRDTDEAKNAKCITIVRQLIRQYRPHVLVMENCASGYSWRCARTRKLLEAIRIVAREECVRVADYDRKHVRRAFAPKKDTIAAAIAGRFPELIPVLPKVRTLIMSQQYAMAIFDAMAFVMTFFYFRNRRRIAEQRSAFASAFGATK